MDEADRLRADLAAKLAILNGTPLPPPPGAPAGTQPAAPTAEPAQPVAPPPMPVCRPAFDLAAWKGNASFPDRLRDLRNAAALGTEGASEMAALAEFYTAYGLTAEALDTLAAWHAEDPLPAERARLDRVTALAHLLRHEPPDPASPLFAEGQGCEREDLPMWRAAAAAVAGDTTQVRKYAGRARALLRDVPDPLRGQIALLIASGAPNDVETQRAMAAVLRTADAPTPEDDAARLLVQARLARAEGSTGDEITFLERAGAITGGAVPALQARARLVAINASREGPVSAGVETALTDIARTYRYEQIGQDASEALAETRLRRGDYAGALSAADDGTLGLRGGESRGAALTARILRTLLVDPGAAALPPPAERMALFWRYEGYATPGERGDDIRLGAARLMLDQRMPESALDVLRQLSPGTAATPPAVTLRALAEARAANGNPQGALALLANTPPSDDTRRAAATALGRLGRAADAAAQLEGMNQVADRLTRAELLMRANDWAGAATTYAGLLADPTLTPEIRRTATDRAALASALAGRAPAALPRDLAGASPAAARALGTIAIPPAALGAPVEAVRDALERARRIETLLSP
ncbi:hypothetical protein [Rhodovastum atsumiense]|uniref:hypothetical protein n=1 Tax=Rhodovastum atsumiense TaxID=504468 RepID=UPI002024E59E|nr:hypothetical protein [Rhodovastum atsumiense]